MKGKEKIEGIRNNHFLTNINMTLCADFFVKTNDGKIENIQHHFAKMYVRELFYELNLTHKTKLSVFLKTNNF